MPKSEKSYIVKFVKIEMKPKKHQCPSRRQGTGNGSSPPGTFIPPWAHGPASPPTLGPQTQDPHSETLSG